MGGRMSDLRQAAEQALDALNTCDPFGYDGHRVRAEAIDALHAALDKLSADDVAEIRNAVRLREIARAAIVREYSNAALAARFGVSVRAVERVLMRETHVQTGGA